MTFAIRTDSTTRRPVRLHAQLGVSALLILSVLASSAQAAPRGGGGGHPAPPPDLRIPLLLHSAARLCAGLWLRLLRVRARRRDEECCCNTAATGYANGRNWILVHFRCVSPLSVPRPKIQTDVGQTGPETNHASNIPAPIHRRAV